jgi:glycosyltransferase involved in cell wall biosynthesis
VPTLFRGDSHLLDDNRRGPRSWLKRAVLQRVYSWPTGFLVTGTANREYYEAVGVEADRLHPCPHSIDVARFAGPPEPLEREAREWRQSLGIAADQTVVLFAGKFEPRKCPIELMRAVASCGRPDVVLVLVGDGVLRGEIDNLVATDRARFRVLPFQNQSRMPVVYRLGDLFALPSSRGETWGLAVNEALACGRAVLVSDRVGCARDAVDASCGRVCSSGEPSSLPRALAELLGDADHLAAMGHAAARHAWAFDIGETERGFMTAVTKVCEA